MTLAGGTALVLSAGFALPALAVPPSTGAGAVVAFANATFAIGLAFIAGRRSR